MPCYAFNCPRFSNRKVQRVIKLDDFKRVSRVESLQSKIMYHFCLICPSVRGEKLDVSLFHWVSYPHEYHNKVVVASLGYKWSHPKGISWVIYRMWWINRCHQQCVRRRASSRLVPPPNEKKSYNPFNF